MEKKNNSMKAAVGRIMVNVGEKEYPCYFTMGAALTFKNLTGKDTTEMKGMADFAAYLFACCQSACRRERLKFPFDDMQEFADGVDADEIIRLSEVLLDTEDEKKT